MTRRPNLPNSLPRQVACEGLLALDEVAPSIPEEAWPDVTTLAIENGRFLTLTLDDLLDLPYLHTLIFNHRYLR